MKLEERGVDLTVTMTMMKLYYCFCYACVNVNTIRPQMWNQQFISTTGNPGARAGRSNVLSTCDSSHNNGAKALNLSVFIHWRLDECKWPGIDFWQSSMTTHLTALHKIPKVTVVLYLFSWLLKPAARISIPHNGKKRSNTTIYWHFTFLFIELN